MDTEIITKVTPETNGIIFETAIFASTIDATRSLIKLFIENQRYSISLHIKLLNPFKCL